MVKDINPAMVINDTVDFVHFNLDQFNWNGNLEYMIYLLG